MNHELWAFVALDLARQRVDEVDRYHHLASLPLEAERSLLIRLRRPLAHGLAVFSRGSAIVVRKLDACVADDLWRSLAQSE